MIGERHIREALDLNECPMCRDGWPVFQGLHELPEPAGMFRCSKTPKDQNPMTSVVTEQELQAKAVAPRVTHDQVEAFIAEERYLTHPDLKSLTICVLVLKNGFTVTGESACADPANFDQSIGDRIARENAKKQIWALLGFELRTKLAMVEDAPAPSIPGMTTHVGTKVIHASPMTRGQYNRLRGWTVPADEDPEDQGYLVEYADGGKGNVPGFFGYVSWSPKDVFDRAYGSPLK